MSTQNILVTGGAGYIGSHACKELAKAGFTPVTYDNLSVGARQAVRWGPLVIGDVGDAGRLRHTIRTYEISAAVHLAASAYVGESVRDPHKYFQNNLVNTIALIDCLLANGVYDLVFSSSCATYGIPERLPISETHPQDPINPYGESKRAIERILPWYASAYGLRWASLRFFNAAGADADGEIGEDHPVETHLIPLAIQAAFDDGSPLLIFGEDHPTPDGTAIRDYVHVTDLAAAHVSAIGYLRAGGRNRAFNLGSGVGHSVAEVISMLEAVSGKRVKKVYGLKRFGDPPALTADASLAWECLGWKAQHSSLREIIDTAWRWANHQRGMEEERIAAKVNEAHAGS